jgi:clathrin heavy chain
MCPIPDLVEEFDQRGRLRMLQSWLESRMDERIQDPALHNALAKIYVDINHDPQNFLINNQYYNSKVVGKYCEDRNPDLAFIAYKRAWGECDEEIIEVTNKNYLFRMQAKYLVER